ncbi:MAG: peptide chain release factor N(5)-glutamine methyltransferase [Bacteroidetes bacterium]|nr:MAG: peptide chain release factor N(5)-glutamine methyltransferase [Bacteroidota bacterium]
MTTADKISKSFKTELKDIYPEREIQTFVEILLEYFAGLSKTDLILKSKETLDQTVIQKMEKALIRLKKTEPLQYIIGETEFYDLKLKVNPSVLIPRPETEELVQWIIEKHKNDKKISILDIGTGSGCISLALKNNLPNAEVFAVDISEKALETAKNNAVINNLDVSFILLDILNVKKNHNLGELNVIVSNPPYVLELEKKLMHKNVLKNEPHLALFVENDNALLFYKAIIKFANNYLKVGGSLYFEINEAFGLEMTALLKENGYQDIELKKDINGKDRMIKGIKGSM